MKKTAICAGALALVATTMMPTIGHAQERGRDDDDKKNNTAAIVAGIAALGIGIAIATSKHGDNHKHDDQWDGNLYGDPFSPSNNVTCIPRQRKCYERGNFSYSWTKRIFGTSAGWGGSGGSGGGFGGSGGSDGGFGGSGSSGQSLDRARRVCIDKGRDRGLRNIYVENVLSHDSRYAYVYLQSRRSAATVSSERYRCEYRYSNSKTNFKRL